jgi:type II secretory pathway pseudopilin PulG
MSARLSKEEHGWLIVEVMISAVVLVIAGLAIFNGLDGASKASGANRNRSEAAALAQQDQERLRSFESSGLSNYHHTGQVTVGGLSYAVTSRAQWVRDTSGTVSCTLDSSQAQYLLITSSVSDPTNRNQPVVAQSLVAPHVGDFSSNTGTAAIQLVDRNGNGVSGINVGLNEPPAPSDTTNSAGCVVFGYLPVLSPGPYHAVFSQPGYVDLLGNNSIGPSTASDNGATTLVAGQTSLTQFSYDLGATLTVSFDTQVGTNAPQAATAFTANVFNTGIPLSPSQRSFPLSAPSNPTSTIAATSLFPFTSSYGVWAGPSACTAANPATWSQTADSIVMQPGGTQSLTVREPAINIVAKDNGTARAGLNVRVSPQSSGCGNTTTYPKQQTSASGTLPNPGYPYGDYSICVDNGVRHVSTTSNVLNHSRSGVNVPTLNIPSSGNAGACP